MGKASETMTIVDDADEEWLKDLIQRFGDDKTVASEAVDSEDAPDRLMDEPTREEVIAEQFEMAEAAKGRKPGKGGTKPNTKQKNARAEQIREEQISRSKEKRNEEAVQEIQAQLTGSKLLKLVTDGDSDANFFVETYAGWVLKSIEKNHGNPVLTPGDIVIENFKRASGPGGQNMQKGESARRATLIWSGITVEASSRSSEQSLKEATEKLETKLKENIATWNDFIGTAGIEVQPKESIQAARERAIRTQVYKIARTS